MICVYIQYTVYYIYICERSLESKPFYSVGSGYPPGISITWDPPYCETGKVSGWDGRLDRWDSL